MDNQDTVIIVPEPVAKNSSVDQIFINNTVGIVRIRKEPSTNSEIVGSCVNKAYYNVYEKKAGSPYTWYRIGTDAWVAGIEEVEFNKASS